MIKLYGKPIIIIILILSLCISFLSCRKAHNNGFELNNIDDSNDNNTRISNDVASDELPNNVVIEYADILKIPVSYGASASLFDKNNLSAIIGYVDYVFIGRVESFIGTNYAYSKNKEGEIIYSDNPMPHSIFNIEILKEIKNDLNDTVEVVRIGGLSKDGKSVFMVGETTLPDIGGIYVFYAIAQNDGSLVLAGEDRHAAIFLDTNSKDIDTLMSYIENSEEYSNLVSAYKNEIVYERIRYIANDDAANTDPAN